MRISIRSCFVKALSVCVSFAVPSSAFFDLAQQEQDRQPEHQMPIDRVFLNRDNSPTTVVRSSNSGEINQVQEMIGMPVVREMGHTHEEVGGNKVLVNVHVDGKTNPAALVKFIGRVENALAAAGDNAGLRQTILSNAVGDAGGSSAQRFNNLKKVVENGLITTLSLTVDMKSGNIDSVGGSVLNSVGRVDEKREAFHEPQLMANGEVKKVEVRRELVAGRGDAVGPLTRVAQAEQNGNFAAAGIALPQVDMIRTEMKGKANDFLKLATETKSGREANIALESGVSVKDVMSIMSAGGNVGGQLLAAASLVKDHKFGAADKTLLSALIKDGFNLVEMKTTLVNTPTKSEVGRAAQISEAYIAAVAPATLVALIKHDALDVVTSGKIKPEVMNTAVAMMGEAAVAPMKQLANGGVSARAIQSLATKGGLESLTASVNMLNLGVKPQTISVIGDSIPSKAVAFSQAISEAKISTVDVNRLVQAGVTGPALAFVVGFRKEGVTETRQDFYFREAKSDVANVLKLASQTDADGSKVLNGPALSALAGNGDALSSVQKLSEKVNFNTIAILVSPINLGASAVQANGLLNNAVEVLGSDKIAPHVTMFSNATERLEAIEIFGKAINAVGMSNVETLVSKTPAIAVRETVDNLRIAATYVDSSGAKLTADSIINIVYDSNAAGFANSAKLMTDKRMPVSVIAEAVRSTPRLEAAYAAVRAGASSKDVLGLVNAVAAAPQGIPVVKLITDHKFQTQDVTFMVSHPEMTHTHYKSIDTLLGIGVTPEVIMTALRTHGPNNVSNSAALLAKGVSPLAVSMTVNYNSTQVSSVSSYSQSHTAAETTAAIMRRDFSPPPPTQSIWALFR